MGFLGPFDRIQRLMSKNAVIALGFRCQSFFAVIVNLFN
jgi:hypothetical protein